MTARSLSDMRRFRYLLGMSTQAEREHIELRYFEDEDAFQEMLTAEDDLIDAYARGELTHEERQYFEKNMVSSSLGIDRVQFALTFANAVSPTQPSEIKLPGTWLDNCKTLGSSSLLRLVIAAIIVFSVVTTWLITDRKRMSNEFHELRANSAEPGKRTETLQEAARAETPNATHLAALRVQPDKPKRTGHVITATPRAPNFTHTKYNTTEIPRSKAAPAETVLNTQSASLGNAFVSKTITELPVDARNVAGLLSLQPATTRMDYVTGSPADQANLILDGMDLHTYSLRPQEGNAETVIEIPSALGWIRFQLVLETAAVHEDYCVTIKTADGHPVTAVNWTEPLTPNQTLIDTPVISTGDLPTGDYLLLLSGKDSPSEFVKVAGYAFKVIRY